MCRFHHYTKWPVLYVRAGHMRDAIALRDESARYSIRISLAMDSTATHSGMMRCITSMKAVIALLGTL